MREKEQQTMCTMYIVQYKADIINIKKNNQYMLKVICEKKNSEFISAAHSVQFSVDSVKSPLKSYLLLYLCYLLIYKL